MVNAHIWEGCVDVRSFFLSFFLFLSSYCHRNKRKGNGRITITTYMCGTYIYSWLISSPHIHPRHGLWSSSSSCSRPLLPRETTEPTAIPVSETATVMDHPKTNGSVLTRQHRHHTLEVDDTVKENCPIKMNRSRELQKDYLTPQCQNHVS